MKYLVKPKKHSKEFHDIVGDFSQKLARFDPLEKAVSIDEYFSEGMGRQTTLKQLREDRHIDTANDFKGIYIFVAGDHAIYTGISKGVIARIHQHIKGHSHHTSSFAFSLASSAYKIKNGNAEKISRRLFDFKKHVVPAQLFLLDQKVAFMPIEDDYELYLFEVYCAMTLETLTHNSFSTH